VEGHPGVEHRRHEDEPVIESEEGAPSPAAHRRAAGEGARQISLRTSRRLSCRVGRRCSVSDVGLSRRLLLGGAAAAAAAPAAAEAPRRPSGYPRSYDRLIEAAQRERQLTIYSSTDAIGFADLLTAFRRRY